MSALPPVIATRGLTRRFGELAAVDDVCLEIAAGEFFGLLGRNGAGKTTLIKMLTTLLPPSAGSASIAGFDLAREPQAVRRVIGYVPQALSADGELTGYENLLVFAKLHGLGRAERERRIAEALALMDLAAFADKLVRTYSGGMIRRLEIAQSTLHRPRVLFLDEPTVGLDPVARTVVWELLRKLQRSSDAAILFTTHDLDEAERLCERVAIMNRGRIVAVGTPGRLRAALGPRATFEQVFERFTGAADEVGGAYDDTSRVRHAAGRLA